MLSNVFHRLKTALCGESMHSILGPNQCIMHNGIAPAHVRMNHGILIFRNTLKILAKVHVVSHVVISLGLGLGPKSQGPKCVDLQPMVLGNWPRLDAHHFELAPQHYYQGKGGLVQTRRS